MSSCHIFISLFAIPFFLFYCGTLYPPVFSTFRDYTLTSRPVILKKGCSLFPFYADDVNRTMNRPVGLKGIRAGWSASGYRPHLFTEAILPHEDKIHKSGLNDFPFTHGKISEISFFDNIILQQYVNGWVLWRCLI